MTERNGEQEIWKASGVKRMRKGRDGWSDEGEKKRGSDGDYLFKFLYKCVLVSG